MPEVPVILSSWCGSIAQNVFQWIGGRTHIKVYSNKPCPIFVVILFTMACNVFALNDTFTITKITGKRQASNTVAFRCNRFASPVEAQDEVMYSVVVGKIDNW